MKWAKFKKKFLVVLKWGLANYLPVVLCAAILIGAISSLIPRSLLPGKTHSATYYDCEPRAGEVCITAWMNVNNSLAYTVYLEGGGISLQTAANLIQLMKNYTRLAWECSSYENCTTFADINTKHKPWAEITAAELQWLVPYIVSLPYKGGDGKSYPGWNGWGKGIPIRAITDNALYSGMLGSIKESLRNWFHNPTAPIVVSGWGRDYSPAGALANTPRAIYAYYDIAPIPNLEGRYVHREKLPFGDVNIYLYYLTFPYDVPDDD